MLQAILHGVLLAIGLILPLGAQNIFVFNQGANQTKFRRALPAIITAGLCDSSSGWRVPYTYVISNTSIDCLHNRISISTLYGVDIVA